MSQRHLGIVRALVVCASVSFAVCAHAGDAERAKALELYEQGKAAYSAGKFSESIALIEEAYALEPAPVLLYNLARAHEAKGALAKAVEAYERYLATEEDVPDRGGIEEKVAVMKRRIEERERLARERDEALKKEHDDELKRRAVVPPPPEESAPSPWPWVVAGIGGAGLVSGAVTGALALSRDNDARVADSQAQTVTLRDEAETLSLASTISFIAGGVILGAGVTWGIVDVTVLGGEADTPKVTVRAAPGSAHVVLTF